MCGNSVPQSRIGCPLFVGNECSRMRSMLVSTWKGGSEKSAEKSGKSPLL